MARSEVLTLRARPGLEEIDLSPLHISLDQENLRRLPNYSFAGPLNIHLPVSFDDREYSAFITYTEAQVSLPVIIRDIVNYYQEPLTLNYLRLAENPYLSSSSVYIEDLIEEVASGLSVPRYQLLTGRVRLEGFDKVLNQYYLRLSQ